MEQHFIWQIVRLCSFLHPFYPHLLFDCLWRMSVLMCVWPVTLYCVVMVSLLVYWVVVMINIYVVVVPLPCWCVRPDSNRAGNPFISFAVFDWACLAFSSGMSVFFDRFNGRSSSIKHESKRKPKRMHLKYYLSTACLVAPKKKSFPHSSFLFVLFSAWMGRKGSHRWSHLLHRSQ